MVALAYKNIHPEAILNELKRREGVSGIEEKNSREK
jgi:phosphoribosyl-ATP pyrophosphohydrolase/phosphoribosyl-AMP cyclohydrolase